MRRGVLVVLAVVLTLAAVAAVVRWTPGGRGITPPPAPRAGPRDAPPAAPSTTSASASAERSDADAAPALEHAREVLATIEARSGEPLPGYVGGRTFQNRERRLPAGRYREYDLDVHVPGRDRGPKRLVIEQRTGRAYYTRDHYRTFVPLN